MPHIAEHGPVMARQELTWPRATAAISHQRFRDVTSLRLGGMFASQASLQPTGPGEGA